ncbi:MAG: hypothetical protein IJZ85_11760 [Lachnospiraceae bacterium]|nr:hypothetical protein [Lachnospiraceae bacterium]
MKKCTRGVVKQILAVSLGVILILSAVYLVGTGLMKRSDVFVGEFTVAEDGKTMEIRAGVASSMGYIRSVSQRKDGDRLNISFYSTFGGLNSRLGARSSFTLDLDDDISEICVYRGYGEYKAIFAKNATNGQWERVDGR